MRKWEKAESACRDRRIVRAESGKGRKPQVGTSGPYMRQTEIGKQRQAVNEESYGE